MTHNLPRSNNIPPFHSANFMKFLRSIKATLPVRKIFLFGRNGQTTYSAKWDKYIERVMTKGANT